MVGITDLLLWGLVFMLVMRLTAMRMSSTAPQQGSGAMNSTSTPAAQPDAGNHQQQQQNLAHVAQGQILQAALNSSMNQQQQHQQPSMDLASVLAKIQSLEKEKADMRSQLDNVSSKLSKLQESKRAEMEQMMNSTISKWLENLNTSDAGAKEQLKDGLNRLVQSGDESGVWNVIACASSNWVSNVNQIETLTTQLNEYREKERLLSGGVFQSEESRIALPGVGDKRRFEGISQAPGSTTGSDHDIWSEFQTMLMASGGNRGADYGLMVAGARGMEPA